MRTVKNRIASLVGVPLHLSQREWEIFGPGAYAVAR